MQAHANAWTSRDPACGICELHDRPHSGRARLIGFEKVEAHPTLLSCNYAGLEAIGLAENSIEERVLGGFEI
jgi:hypothetical protein